MDLRLNPMQALRHEQEREESRNRPVYKQGVTLTTLLVLAILGASCKGDRGDVLPATPLGQVEVVGAIPHAGSAWTEGLIVSDGSLWESVGGVPESEIRGIDRETGAILWSVPNGGAFFAEGVVRAFGRAYVLSYKEGQSYLFDRDAADPFQPFATYDGEGWGLTAAGSHLVNSNGSSSLFYRDPDTFEVVRTVPVAYDGQPVPKLNELEFDGQYLWAHQWQTSLVYRIAESDPSDVVQYTLPPEVCPEGFPNGIAWDEELDLFFVTGQRCNSIWKVRFH